jgi:hypothetical protein
MSSTKERLEIRAYEVLLDNRNKVENDSGIIMTKDVTIMAYGEV